MIIRDLEIAIYIGIIILMCLIWLVGFYHCLAFIARVLGD